MLMDRGVIFHEASNVEAFEGTDIVQTVVLRNYKKNEANAVPADLVLVAIGTFYCLGERSDKMHDWTQRTCLLKCTVRHISLSPP